MVRFFGMMPSNEIEITGVFDDGNGFKIYIDAGKNGWTVMWADHSTDYEDIKDTAENNYKRACDRIYQYFRGAKEISKRIQTNKSKKPSTQIEGEC